MSLKNIFRRRVETSSSSIRPNQESLLDVAYGQWKRVYWLSDELRNDPKRVELTRALTQDEKRPQIGLRGTHGLFASSEWWNSINQRKMPLQFISGTVVRAYKAGQDEIGETNTIDLVAADGSTVSVGIYVNDHQDTALFKPGIKVEIVYALDTLKRQPAADGTVAYSKVALEMAVSVSHTAHSVSQSP